MIFFNVEKAYAGKVCVIFVQYILDIILILNVHLCHEEKASENWMY